MHLRFSLGTKFQLQFTILSFWGKLCPKRVFLVWNRKSYHHYWILIENYKTDCFPLKFALLRASIFFSYYIKLFHMGANRYNSILMSFLFLVAETIIVCHIWNVFHNHDACIIITFLKKYRISTKPWRNWKKFFHLFPFFILQLRSQDHNEDNKPTRSM